MNKITQEELKQCLSYDKDTGVFTWSARNIAGISFGSLAGTVHHSGYVNIKVRGKVHLAHRLAWIYVYGSLPDDGQVIDHVNRVKTDNRICNLRTATNTQNNYNTAIRTNNTSGLIGVHLQKQTGKYVANARLQGKQHYLGLFKCKYEASKARESFVEKAHGEFYLKESK